jgi:hypothetical protein
LAIPEDYGGGLPKRVQHHANRQPSASNSGTMSRRLDELLAPEASASPAEVKAIHIAWKHLFAQAEHGVLASADAHIHLRALDSVWDHPTPTMLTGLLDEASTQLKAIAKADAGAAVSVAPERREAACEVQFRLAQFAAVSQLRPLFAWL